MVTILYILWFYTLLNKYFYRTKFAFTLTTITHVDLSKEVDLEIVYFFFKQSANKLPPMFYKFCFALF